jgi:hypothetical protein
MTVSAGLKIIGKRIIRKNKVYIPLILFTNKEDAYDELGVHENRGIRGFVKGYTKKEMEIIKRDLRMTDVRYAVYLPERL